MERIHALPPGGRLLHIGIPKTGTTALQRAAAARRDQLRDQGVLYPGRTVNHREAVCALMGRRLGWLGAGDYVPARGHWDRVMAEVAEYPDARVFLSHEFAAECTTEQAARFRAVLGPGLHVVISLRGFAHLLPSSWQQYVKAGRRTAWHPWLQEVLADKPGPGSAGFYRRNDQAVIVRRWVDVMGPEHVTVVIADKDRPTQLTDAFEQLLGLSSGLLHLPEGSGFASNRALSWPEAELIRGLNAHAHRPVITWFDYDLIVRSGGIARLLESRQPGPGEPAVRLPRWAADSATARARHYADEIADAGCRVVGDLDTLWAPVAVTGAEGADSMDVEDGAEMVPLDAAVALAAGLVSASLGRGAFFDIRDKATTPTLRRMANTDRGRRLLELSHRNSSVPPSDLLLAGALSGLRRLGTRIRG